MSTQTIYATGNWVNQDNAMVLNGRLLGGSQFIPTPIPPGGGGTLSNLRIRRITAPVAATSHTITVRKSGVGTAVTATIAAGANYAEDTAHSVTFADTDTISVFTTKVGAPGSSDYQVAFDYTPTTANLSIYGFNSSGTTNFNAPFFGLNGSAAESDVSSSEVPCSGTFSSLAVLLKTAPGVGNSRTFLLRLNGVDQDGTGGTPDTRAVVSGANTGASASFTLSVAAGDVLTVKQTTSGTPAGSTNLTGSVAFTPTSGALAVAAANSDVANTGGTSYNWAISGINADLTEANVQMLGGVTTQYVSTMYLSLRAAPGAGKSWTCALRNNGADTGLAVTISGASDRRGHAIVAPIPIASGDLWDLKFTATGTPATTTRPVRVALALTATPSAGPLFQSMFF